MSKTKAILVDFENIQPNLDILQSVDTENVEIYIFVGQNQKKLPVELVNSILKLKSKSELIQIEGIGKNALDFHIAYFIGKLSKEKDYSFNIISKDTGFDILIKYLKKDNIDCSRKTEIKCVLQKSKAEIFEEKLLKSPKNKPQKEKTLISSITSHFKPISETEVKDIIETLKKKKVLSIDANSKVLYR